MRYQISVKEKLTLIATKNAKNAQKRILSHDIKTKLHPAFGIKI
jgi:UDP-N-acetylenolpyruvoylglucosamine reductase